MVMSSQELCLLCLSTLHCHMYNEKTVESRLSLLCPGSSDGW